MRPDSARSTLAKVALWNRGVGHLRRAFGKRFPSKSALAPYATRGGTACERRPLQIYRRPAPTSPRP